MGAIQHVHQRSGLRRRLRRRGGGGDHLVAGSVVARSCARILCPRYAARREHDHGHASQTFPQFHG